MTQRPGLESARKRGRKGGRRAGLSKTAKTKAWAALKLLNDKEKSLSVAEIQEQLGLSKATYYRYIAWAVADEKTRKVMKTHSGFERKG